LKNIASEKEGLGNNMEPTILYEDENILVVNKPSGLLVHPDAKEKTNTLVHWLISKYPEIENVGEVGKNSKGEEVLRSGVVHRLDRETSGVMLVTKTQKAFEFLKKQFKAREVQKTYRAFVFGEVKGDKGKIERPIGRSSTDFRKWSAQRGARGEMREAITEYRVISRGKGYSYLEVKPKTGRTHQIRVHLKAINHPLLADSLYSPNRENELGFKRLALHSYNIVFTDLKGEKKEISAPLPPEFISAEKVLQVA
jgi:23S rRNA pseudouridine1911/1915/1917 synthase